MVRKICLSALAKLLRLHILRMRRGLRHGLDRRPVDVWCTVEICRCIDVLPNDTPQCRATKGNRSPGESAARHALSRHGERHLRQTLCLPSDAAPGHDSHPVPHPKSSPRWKWQERQPSGVGRDRTTSRPSIQIVKRSVCLFRKRANCYSCKQSMFIY